MNLEKKKKLASRALGIALNRIAFNTQRLDEIKEAITKQDIKDLFKDGAIRIKEIKGTRKVVKRTTRRRHGSVRKKLADRKKGYMQITRKLRAYLAQLKRKEQISLENYYSLRKEIRARVFKDKNHLKERIKEVSA